jgi:hypothetical protein
LTLVYTTLYIFYTHNDQNKETNYLARNATKRSNLKPPEEREEEEPQPLFQAAVNQESVQNNKFSNNDEFFLRLLNGMLHIAFCGVKQFEPSSW